MMRGSSGGRRRWRTVGAALSLALVTPTASLLAAAPAGRVVRLVYTRASGAERCPGQDEIERQVRARLGYEPFAGDASATLSAVIRTAGRGLRARIELRGASGKVEGVRELDSSEGDCDELAASVAFAVSMAIDPLAAVRAPASATASPARPQPSARTLPSSSSVRPEPAPRASSVLSSSAPATLAPSASAPSASASSAPLASSAASSGARPVASFAPLELSVSGGALVASGLGPELGGGAALGIDARRDWASVGFEARFLASNRKVSADRGIASWLVAGALVSCGNVRPLFFCAVGMLGLMQGKDYGLETSHRERFLVASAGGRAGLQIMIDEPMWARLSGEVLFNLTPHTLSFNQQPAWTTPVMAGVVGLTLGVSF